MDRDAIIFGVVAGTMGLMVVGAYFAARRDKRREADAAKRHEAVFQSAFPDLQPYFHPVQVWEFVKARRSRDKPTANWRNPPGFAAAGVAVARAETDRGRETVTLLDGKGARLAQFLFESHAEGGVLRVGRGKFTAILGQADPRVRYWHPEREFKWSRRKGWVFTLPALDSRSEGDTSSTSGTSSSFSSSSDSSPHALSGGGGTFDGGGASGGWDDGGNPDSATPAY